MTTLAKSLIAATNPLTDLGVVSQISRDLAWLISGFKQQQFE